MRTARSSLAEGTRALRVLLINMPFGSASWPPLGLGLLKSRLTALGVEARIENLNMRFADRLGPLAYDYLAFEAPQHALAGEWVFSHCLNGRPLVGPEEYFTLVARSRQMEPISDRQRRWILRARELADPFLRDCLERVHWSSYDLVGFTSSFAQNVSSLALARRVKERSPDTLIAFGGVNCEDAMGLELHRSFEFVDYVFTDEADLSLPQVIGAVGSDRQIASVPGVVAREGDASHWTSLRADRVKDLDDVLYPDFDDFFQDGRHRSHRVMPMETARGCWWGDKHHCTFCGIDFSTKYRSKSPDRALAELWQLTEKYSPDLVFMTDEILDMRYFRTLLPALADSRRNFEIFYETKANLSREQVRLLADAGVRSIQPGIESLSTETLRLMRKGTTALQNVEFLKWCKEYGVRPLWNLLVGFPAEDDSGYPAMIELVESLTHLQPPIGAGIVRMDRFSPYVADPAAFGIEVQPIPAYEWIYDLPAESLAQLAYFFERVSGTPEREDFGDVLSAVEDWKAENWRSSLTYGDDGHTLRISDERRGRSALTRLTEWRRELFLHCTRRRRFAAAVAYGETRGASTDATEEFISALISRKLFVHVDGSLLALPIPKHSDLMPTESQVSTADQ
jgi:ribosomal peptide maturation radical SAM protein 1